MEQTAEKIAKAAYKGIEPEGFCDLTDWHLHTCLTLLYKQYKDGMITKEQAEDRKQKLVTAWKSDKVTEERWRAMTAEHAENIRKVFGMCPEKSETPAECIRILAEMVAVMTGDDSLPKRLGKKFGE